jgi:lipopolysaccharide export system permease protein
MMPLLTKIDRYILKKFLGTFFLSLLLISIVVIVFDISEKIEDFLSHDVALKEIVFDYYLNFLPYFMNLFSPQFTLISVIFFTSRLAARTEFVAMFSAGISYNRLIRTYMIGAGIIAILSLALNTMILPVLNKTRLQFESKYVGGRFIFDGRDIHRQVAPGVFVYLQHYDNQDNIGTQFTLEKLEGRTLVMKLSARELRWDSLTNRWSIRDYMVRTIRGKKEKLFKGARIDTTLNLSPKDFSRAQNVMESMTYSQLNDFIENEKLKGSDNVQLFEIEKYKRIAFPFATFILTLIGFSVSSRKVRGGVGRHLASGIAIGFIFILFNQVFTSYAQSGVMPAIIAVWVPNILFGIVALIMVRMAPK